MKFLLDVYNVLLPIILTGLMGWIGAMITKQKKEKKIAEDQIKLKEEKIAQIRHANSEGIKIVLRYMLGRYHTEYMAQGKITYTQYENWIDIFNAYTALNGNSIAVEWNNDIENIEKCDKLNTLSVFEAMVRETTKYTENR